MSEAPPPAADWALRVVVASAGVCTVAAIVRAAWAYTEGAVSLPSLYLVAAAAAGSGAVLSQRRWLCATLAALVPLVAITEIATRARRGNRPGGVRAFMDAHDIMWMRLPEGWVENERASNRPKDNLYGTVRQFVPQDQDRFATAHIQVTVHRTPNNSFERLEQTPAVTQLLKAYRGAAAGHRWLREENGVGEVGLELHHLGWRVHVYLQAALETRRRDLAFERLRKTGEAMIDSVQMVPTTVFARIDRGWFGR